MGRALLAAAVLLLVVSNAPAQERTLLNTEDIESGAFGGPQVCWTTFNGESGMLVGGTGAWVLNREVYLGGGGYKLTTNHDGLPVGVADKSSRLHLGYGGVVAGVIVRNDNLIHITAEVMLGGGSIVRSTNVSGNKWEDHGEEGFWQVQPMVHAEMNVTTWVRAALSVGFRLVRDFNSFGLTAGGASGPVVGVTLRFGSW